MARRPVKAYGGEGSKFDHRTLSAIKAGPQAKAVAKAKAQAAALKKAEKAVDGAKAALAGVADNAPPEERAAATQAVVDAEQKLAELSK